MINVKDSTPTCGLVGEAGGVQRGSGQGWGRPCGCYGPASPSCDASCASCYACVHLRSLPVPPHLHLEVQLRDLIITLSITQAA